MFRTELLEQPSLIHDIASKREKYLMTYLKDILIYGISRGEVKMLTSEQMDAWTTITHISWYALGSKVFHEKRMEFMLDHLEFIANSWFAGVLKK